MDNDHEYTREVNLMLDDENAFQSALMTLNNIHSRSLSMQHINSQPNLENNHNFNQEVKNNDLFSKRRMSGQSKEIEDSMCTVLSDDAEE